MNRFLIFAVAGSLVLSLASQANAAEAAKTKPNVIVMLIDDMGGHDVGCYGNKAHQTPNIDALAASGMKFTHAYSACTVCSPTRAALLTGKYPARLHLTDWIAGHEFPKARLKIPDWTKELKTEEETIAERLKSAGYATASIGKWHLGGEEHYPEKHGFDVNIGGTAKGQPPSYFSPYGISTLPDGPPGEFLSDRLTTEAEKFIEAQASAQKPFFLYFPHFAVHTPLMGKKEIIEKYKAARQDMSKVHPTYAALVESVDDSVGRLVKTLEKLKLRENTLFIFTSDNGGLSGSVGPKGWSDGPADNSPQRWGKGGAYDGGVRVPLIANWPNVVPAGKVSPFPVSSIDFYPTILDVCGVEDASGHQSDGLSLMPILKGEGKIQREALYWHYPHYHPGGATPHSAIRKGEWKLILFHEDQHVELYHLGKDVGEMDNLAPVKPELAKSLREQLEAWLKETNAQLPTPNPAFQAPN